jgi:hypothetical protein
VVTVPAAERSAEDDGLADPVSGDSGASRMVRDMRVLLSWFGTAEIPDGREQRSSPADVRGGRRQLWRRVGAVDGLGVSRRRR